MKSFFKFLCVFVFLFIACALFSSRAWAQTPSFNCQDAKTPAEIAICKTPSLAAADEALAQVYRAAQLVDGVNLPLLKTEELAWLKARNTQCVAKDKSNVLADKVFLQCLEDSYQNRIAELNQGGGSTLAPCFNFMAALAPLTSTTIPVYGYVSAAVAAQKGSPLTIAKYNWISPAGDNNPYEIDKLIGTNYILKSTYVGTANCQRPHLYQQIDGVEKEIPVPLTFAPQEADHCMGDRVYLISLNGVLGLLDETPWPMIPKIVMSLKEGDTWTPECSVNILEKPHYQVAIASYASKSSSALTDAIEKYVKGNSTTISWSPPEESTLSPVIFPAVSSLSPTQHVIYSKMLDVAEDFSMDERSTVPFFGSPESQEDLMYSTGCQSYFNYGAGSFFPILLNGELLLGKIGTDGRDGSPNDAVAVYAFISGKLKPYAGFCVKQENQTIESFALEQTKSGWIP